MRDFILITIIEFIFYKIFRQFFFLKPSCTRHPCFYLHLLFCFIWHIIVSVCTSVCNNYLIDKCPYKCPHLRLQGLFFIAKLSSDNCCVVQIIAFEIDTSATRMDWTHNRDNKDVFYKDSCSLHLRHCILISVWHII